MAYKKLKPSFDVTGKSARELSELGYENIKSLGERDLARINSRMVSAVNKSIRRLEQAGISSPAIMKLGNEFRFSVKFENIPSEQRRGKLLQQYGQLSNFLHAKTSTIRGAKAYRKEQIEKIESAIGRKVTKGETDKAFRILHEAQESGIVDGKRGSTGSLQAREIVFDILNDDINLSDDEILERLNNEYNEWYIEQETEKTLM